MAYIAAANLPFLCSPRPVHLLLLPTLPCYSINIVSSSLSLYIYVCIYRWVCVILFIIIHRWWTMIMGIQVLSMLWTLLLLPFASFYSLLPQDSCGLRPHWTPTRRPCPQLLGVPPAACRMSWLSPVRTPAPAPASRPTSKRVRRTACIVLRSSPPSLPRIPSASRFASRRAE